MKGKNKYLIFAIIGSLLLVFFLLLIELKSLRRNEKIITQAYENQLKTILFSVNDYSDNVLKSIEIVIDYSIKKGDSVLPNLQQDFPFVKDAFLLNKEDLTDDKATFKKDKNKDVKTLYFTQYLEVYKENNEEGLQPNNIENTGLMMFSKKVSIANKEKVVAFIFDVSEFVTTVIMPRIQDITKGQSSVVLLNSINNPITPTPYQSKKSSIEESIPLHAFNNMKLGILQTGESLNKLTTQRDNNYLYQISLLCIILFITGWLIFRMFKKQIELAQQKTDFVSNISHEIRTPISLISLYAETIAMDRVKSKKDYQKFVSIISEESLRLSTLVNKILLFSKIEKATHSYNIKPNNLNDVIAKMYGSYVPYFEKHNFKHNLILSKSVSELDFDIETIKDVFINLIENAIKYSFENKEITIRTGIKEAYVYFEIQDIGIGIEANDKKHLFDKFYRTQNTNVASKTKGTGLGLYIVKQIVDAHKGLIEVESKLNKGATFRVLLPK